MEGRLSRMAPTVALTILMLAAPPAGLGLRQEAEVATVETNLGRFTFRLYPDKSPRTVQAFVERVHSGFYDGTQFHKVLPGLLIEGGKLDEETAGSPAPGSGDSLEIETSDLVHDRGTVAMAHERQETRSREDFFICLQRIQFFDGKYTIIGQILTGLEVVEAISNVPRNLRQAPLFPIWIRSLRVDSQNRRP